jgi:hypothetical protein
MANLGSTLEHEIIVFDDCPSQLRDIYQADRMGVTTPRMILL